MSDEVVIVRDLQEPTDPEIAPIPDITRDRIVIVVGAVTFPVMDVMVHASDNAPAWVTLVPIEDSAHEKESREKGLNVYSRERDLMILHEMQIGTVDELVECYRERLTGAFNRLVCKTNDGYAVIPYFGEASLRKQTETLQRHNCDKFDATGWHFKVDPGVARQREALRDEQRNYPVRQDFFDRDMLKRTVALWTRKRFNDHMSVAPTDNPDLVQELIDALRIVQEDRWRDEDIGIVKKQGLTREVLFDMCKQLVTHHEGRDPKKITLTADQIKEVNALDDWDHPVLMGMTVQEGPLGPILE